MNTRRKNRRIWCRIWSGLVTGLLVMGFAVSAPAAEVNYRLKWLFNVSVLGDIWAVDHKLFAEKGLDVEVLPGGLGQDPMRDLELGRLQFGVASADQVIRARAKGAPVVVVAQLFQVSPMQWIYRADRRADQRTGSRISVTSPSDLKGLRIGVTYGGNDEAIMRTLLAKAGLEEKDVHLFGVRYDFTPFYRDEVDLWPVYRNAQGPIIEDKLKREGEGVAFLNPHDLGIWFVANSVITSEKIVAERPEMVTAFLDALLRGWEASLAPEHRAEALDVLRKYDRDTPPDLLPAQYDLTRSLVKPDDAPIGRVNRDAWRQTAEIMTAQGLVSGPVDVDSFLHPFPDAAKRPLK